MSVARFLVDASAIARYADPAVAARLDGLAMDGLAVSCGAVELELLAAVRNTATRAKAVALRAVAFEVLETTGADFRRAAEVQALLVERGDFGVAWPALLVAAVAERHGVTVLHCDPCYEVIGKLTEQAEERVCEGDRR